MATATTPQTEVEEFRALLMEAERRGLLPPTSFHSFLTEQNPSLLDFEHVQRLCPVLDRLVHGEITRLLIFAPPRYFKSELCSRQLPAYFLRHHPDRMVGLSSYGADLAWELSEEARNNFEGSGGRLSEATSAKKRWATAQHGEMWASGVGGPMLGRGFHLGIVDDPVDPEQAVSPTYQRRFTRWWPEKFLSRQEPGARIAVIMQRLGVEDPADYLLRREVGEGVEKAPENWHVVVFDEVHSEEPLGRWKGVRGLPPTCTLEPDWRKKGEVLAPSRFSAKQVERLQTSAGPLVTASQRQQRPMRPKGDFWRKTWFRTYKDLPDDAYDRGLDWDTAYGEKETNAASAWVESFRGPGEPQAFPIYINDVDWDWLEFPGLVGRMRSLTGPHYIEQKASGKSAAQALKAEGLASEEIAVKGDKMARASAVQPVVSNRRVWVREEIANHLWYGERQGLLRVTVASLMSGAGLDLNDAFVQALHRHIGMYGPERRRVMWAK